MPTEEFANRVLEAPSEEAQQLLKHQQAKDRELRRGALQTLGYGLTGSGLGTLAEAPPVAEQAIANVVGAQQEATAQRAATTSGRYRSKAAQLLAQASDALKEAILDWEPSPTKSPGVTQRVGQAGEAVRAAVPFEQTAARAAERGLEERLIAQTSGMKGGTSGPLAAVLAGAAPSLMFLGEYERMQDFGNQLRNMSLRLNDHPLLPNELNTATKDRLRQDPQLSAQLYSEGVLSHALYQELGF